MAAGRVVRHNTWHFFIVKGEKCTTCADGNGRVCGWCGIDERTVDRALENYQTRSHSHRIFSVVPRPRCDMAIFSTSKEKFDNEMFYVIKKISSF